MFDERGLQNTSQEAVKLAVLDTCRSKESILVLKSPNFPNIPVFVGEDTLEMYSHFSVIMFQDKKVLLH